MATIITVHGTGASGPEEGNKWWQKGSEFEKHIRELVQSTDGELHFQPHTWDGANSEISRRKAAARLYGAAKTLENGSEKYCLIGHSHGGSIIAATLLLASSTTNRLRHLTCFIAVATPFIQSVKSFWLFSRLYLIGKSVLVCATTFTFFLAVSVYTEIYGRYRGNWSEYVTALVVFCPIAVIYALLWVLNRRRFYRYRAKILITSANAYAARLVSFRHRHDEAISGLKSLRNIDIRVFQRNFAVSPFAFTSLFVLPALFALLVTSPQVLTELDIVNVKFGGSSMSSTLPLADKLSDRMYFATAVIGRLVSTLVLQIPGVSTIMSQFSVPAALIMLMVVFAIMVFLMICASLLTTYVVSLFGFYVSSVLSVTLNELTWKQIRKIGFGDDTVGEIAINADSTCLWLPSEWLPLPDQLAREIADISNKAASAAVEKFRSLVSELALSREREIKSFFFSEYLTWDELIHCSYFNVPHFRMLVAYAIAHSEGFKPTEAFKNHPDYNLVAGWYEEIKPKEP
jgi:hypothetical protein